MKTEHIQLRINEINKAFKDGGMAHGLEDDLYRRFVRYVATDPEDDDLGEKAKLILTTEKIKFGRWIK